MSDPDETRAIADSYSAMASAYVDVWAPVLRPYTARLIERVRFDGARRVLDLGTGVGTMLADLAGAAPEALIVGTDLSEGMIRLAPARFPRVIGDVERSPFAEAVFDVIVSAFVFFNVTDPALAFAQTRDRLAPGGTFAVTTWGDPDDARDPAAYEIFLEELEASGAGADPAPVTASSRKELGTPERLGRFLEAAGLVEVRTAAMPFVHTLDADGYVRERASIGPTRRRLATLPPDARAACLERARRRLAALTPEDLTDHDTVVMGWSIAPRSGGEGPVASRR